MLLDLPLALEVGYPRLSVSAAHGAVDEVINTSRPRRIGYRLALLHLAIVAGLPEVLHGENAVDAFDEHLIHSGAVFHISLHYLGALLS